MDTINLREYIESITDSEQVEVVEICLRGGCNRTEVPKEKLCKTVPWHEARAWLDFEIKCGHGSEKEDYYFVTAWTPSWVIFTDIHDGKLKVRRMPRHPRCI